MIRVVVMYDIADDKERLRASEMCLDYGLDRHQYSVFTGKLKPTHLRELAKKLRAATQQGRITLVPVQADDWERRVEVNRES